MLPALFTTAMVLAIGLIAYVVHIWRTTNGQAFEYTVPILCLYFIKEHNSW